MNTREELLERQLRDAMLELIGIIRTASVLYGEIRRTLYGEIPLVWAGEQKAATEREEAVT